MYRFSAACKNEKYVFGSCRPGYSEREVREWIEFMKRQGIMRVCCLLDEKELNRYSDLLRRYQQNFGGDRVLWTPIEDFHLCDRVRLTQEILPFLAQAEQMGEKIVIHCNGGIGRTGHVLAAWLVTFRGLSNQEAFAYGAGGNLAIVKEMGRNPYEAATAEIVKELDELLSSCRLFFNSENL